MVKWEMIYTDSDNDEDDFKGFDKLNVEDDFEGGFAFFGKNNL